MLGVFISGRLLCSWAPAGETRASRADWGPAQAAVRRGEVSVYAPCGYVGTRDPPLICGPSSNPTTARPVAASETVYNTTDYGVLAASLGIKKTEPALQRTAACVSGDQARSREQRTTPPHPPRFAPRRVSSVAWAAALTSSRARLAVRPSYGQEGEISWRATRPSGDPWSGALLRHQGGY